MRFKSAAFLFPLILFSVLVYGQKDSALPGQKNNSYTIQLDTVKVKTVESINPKRWYESSSMPWIAAAFIGILTLLTNLILSHYTRRTSIDIAKKQLERSAKDAIAQFQATINSKNRQDWIIDVRQCLSELLAQCRQINIEFQEKSQDKIRQKEIHEKISFNRNKIRLLLTAHLPLHKKLLDSLYALINDLDFHMLKSSHGTEDFDNLTFMQKSDQVVDDGRELLYNEWQKIQNAKID